MSEKPEVSKIVLPTRENVRQYGKPRIDPEHDILSVLLARTDTKIGKAITDAALSVMKKVIE